jgi:hypothetical protein
VRVVKCNCCRVHWLNTISFVCLLCDFVVAVISELACFVYSLGNYMSLAYQNIIATGYVYQNFMFQASSYLSLMSVIE